MNTTLLREAEGLVEHITALRRELHAHPELGNREFDTARRIEAELDAMAIPHRRLTETGICAEIQGALPGETIALRADMDALPIAEEADVPWRSQSDGVMHACGHDMHMAGLLGAARLIAAHRQQLHGAVRLLFQPDEEGDGGAARMVAAGCMRGVSAAFGAHCEPELPTGQVGVKYGAMYAMSNPFDIRITGRSAHAAEAWKGADAIVAASATVLALQTLASRESAPDDPMALSIGAFNAGVARNIVAGSAELNGTLRCYGDARREYLSRRVRDIAVSTAEALNCAAEVDVTWGYRGVMNTDAETDAVCAAARAALGAAPTIERAPTLMTEDFGEYVQAAGRGCFFHIGVMGKSCAPLHNPRFDPDEAALPALAAVLAQLALGR